MYAIISFIFLNFFFAILFGNYFLYKNSYQNCSRGKYKDLIVYFNNDYIGKVLVTTCCNTNTLHHMYT